MNIGDYKSFYNLIGSRPKKSLGQNFLIDKNILIKIFVHIHLPTAVKRPQNDDRRTDSKSSKNSWVVW